MTPQEMRRLALIRFLLDQAVDQVRRPGQFVSVAVLSFHDAADLFLQLAAQHLNVAVSPQKAPSVLQNLDRVSEALSPAVLPERGAMRWLNEARNGLKHGGVIPDRREVADNTEHIRRFFEQGTPLVFGGRSLESFSIIDFVALDSVKNALDRANKALEQGEVQEGLIACAEAFHELMLDEDASSGARRNRTSPFYFGDPFSHFTLSVDLRDDYYREWREVQKMRDAVEEMRKALRILSYGLDYQRYARFRSLTPSPEYTYDAEGVRERQFRFESHQPAGTSDDVAYCIDFVVDSALRLQEFDEGVSS